MNIILSGNTSTGTGTLTYEWKDSSNNVIGVLSAVTVTSGDTYSLTVTDSYNGSTNTEYITVSDITGDPIANISSITTEFVTNNQEIILDGSGSYGQYPESNLIYSWSTNDGEFSGSTSGSSATAITGGTYTLVVTDIHNQCTGTTTQLLTVSIAPSTPPTPLITIDSPTGGGTGGDDIDCLITSRVLDGTTSYSATGAPVSYLWSTAETTPTITVSASGTYTLTVTDTSNGLVSITTASITLTLNQDTPDNTLTPSATVLTNVVTSITLTAFNNANYSYLWTTSNGNIASGANSRIATINTPGDYNLLVTDNSNGCTNTSAINITETITLPIARISGGNIINCDISSITLNSNTSSSPTTLTYEWFDGSLNLMGTASTQVVSSADTYTLTVTDTSLNESSDTHIVTKNVISPSISIIKSPDITEISNTNPNVILGGPSGTTLTYLWSTGASTQNITISSGGTYTLTIEDTDNGCTNSASVILTQDTSILPVANITITQEGSVVDCLDGLTIETIYVQTTADVALLPAEYTTSCGIGGHGCDRGFWEVYGNGVYIGDSLLNNAGGADPTGVQTISGLYTCTDYQNTPAVLTGGSWAGSSNARYSTITINQTQALAIAAAGNGNVIDFSLEPTMTTYNVSCSGQPPSAPHTNVTWTRITDSNDNILYNGCPNGNFVSLDVCSTSTSTVPVTGSVNFSCSISTITLNGQTSTNSIGTNNNLTYQWKKNGVNVGTNVTYVATEPGTYSLTVTDTTNQTSSLINTQVIGDISNSGSVTIGALNGIELNENYDELPLIASASGLSNKTYVWSTSNGTFKAGTNIFSANVIITSPGTYDVTVVDSVTNCQASKSVTVSQNGGCNLIVTVAGGNTLTCEILDVNITASTVGVFPLSYEWRNQANSVVGSTKTINVSDSDTYSVVVTDGNNCTGTTSYLVSEFISTPSLTIDKTPNVTELSSDVSSILLSASTNANNSTYAWRDVPSGTLIGSFQTYSVTSPGTYQVTVVDSISKCSATTQVTITADLPLPNVSISGPSEFTCDGSNITLNSTSTGTGTLYYNWTGGSIVGSSTSSSVTISSPATYTLTVTDDNGSTVKTYTVDPATSAPTVTVTAPTTQLTIGGQITLTASPSGAGYTYEWYLDGVLIPDDRNYMYATQTGTYTIIITPFVPTCIEYIFGGTGTATVDFIDCYDTPQSLTVDGIGASGYDQETFCASEIQGVSGTGVGLSDNGPCGYTPEPCSGSGSITITAQDVAPTAIIIGGTELNCDNTIATEE